MAWGTGFEICFAPALGLTLACSSLVLTAHPEDRRAPSDYLAAAQGASSSCTPPVELVRSAAHVERPFTEVASLSANCYPGAPLLCERLLLQHACEHHADAVILTPAQPNGTPPGASGESQISINGRAVRWMDEPPPGAD